jgi:MFS family permease
MPSRAPVDWMRVLGERLGIVRRGLAPPDPADIVTPEERRNTGLLIAEAPFTNLALGAVVNFFALFAIQLGASNSMVGWLSSGPALVALLWLLPAGRLIQRAENYGRALALGALVQRIMLLGLAAVPLLPAAWRAWGVIFVVTLNTLPANIWGLSLHASTGELYQPRHLTRLVGMRWAAGNVSGVVSTLLLGRLLDVLAFPFNFQVMFAGVAVISLATVWIVLQLRYPPRDEEGGTVAQVTSLRSLAKQLSQHRAFMRYEVGVVLGYMALLGAVPLYRIYWVRDLGANGAWVGGLTAAFSVGVTAGNLLWGRWSRPMTERRNMLIATLGMMGLYPIFVSLFPSLPLQLPVVTLAGFFSGGNDLLLFNRTVQVTPRKQRPTFIAAHNLTVNAAGFVAPLISSSLVGLIGTRLVLAGVGVLGVLRAALIYWLGWLPSLDEAAPDANNTGAPGVGA